MKLKLNLNENYNFIIELLFVTLYAIFKKKEIIYAFFIIIYFIEIILSYKEKKEKIIEQILLLVPIMGITTINHIPLLNIYISLFLVYTVLFSKKIMIMKKELFIVVFFIVFDIIKYLLNINNISINTLDVFNIIVFYMCVCSIYVVYIIYVQQKEIINRLAISFIKGTIVTIAYGFITRLISGGLIFALVNKNIMTRNFGASGDPNYYGLYIAISVAIIFTIFIIKKKDLLKNYILAIVMLFMGLSSSSRMYYILFAIIVVALGISLFNILFSKRYYIGIGLIVIGIVLVFFGKEYIMSNLNFVLERNTYSSDLSNGRTELIQSYMRYFNDSIGRNLFGIGIPKYNARSGISTYAHNFYIEILVTQGFIGTVMIITIICVYLKKIKIKFRYALPLIIVSIGGLAINIIEVESFYILLSILIFLISYYSNENDNYEKFNK